MNNNRVTSSWRPKLSSGVIALAMLALQTAPVQAATAAAKATPCSTIESAPMVHLSVGKSFRLRTPSPVARILMGNPAGGQAAQPKAQAPAATAALALPPPASNSTTGAAAVDALLLSPSEIYLLGKNVGSTNIILLGRSGQCTLVDIAVGIDAAPLQNALDQMMMGQENRIKVTSAAESLILTGTVADAVKVDKAIMLAAAYTGGEQSKIVNMLSVADPQQVMLEVKVAEVSKTLLDKMGVSLAGSLTTGGWTYSWLSDFLSGGKGLISGSNAAGSRRFSVDGQKDDGLVKVLAEPTVMALSGQQGSFLAGGKILIPVAQSGQNGVQTITLEEKEFGVGLKFTPTVLDGGRINLVVAPEVSELSKDGVALSSKTGTALLPLITTRRASTTVQLRDGQSFAIGGLIKNNVTQSINAFPVLGEIPILGALFRSSSFQTDKTELIFVVTPRLVKPLPADYKLPTDNFIEPSRAQFFLGGKMEGTPPQAADARATAMPDTPASPAASGGLEVK